MELEPLIQRLQADASQWSQTFTRATQQLDQFSNKVLQVNSSLGSIQQASAAAAAGMQGFAAAAFSATQTISQEIQALRQLTGAIAAVQAQASRGVPAFVRPAVQAAQAAAGAPGFIRPNAAAPGGPAGAPGFIRPNVAVPGANPNPGFIRPNVAVPGAAANPGFIFPNVQMPGASPNPGFIFPNVQMPGAAPNPGFIFPNVQAPTGPTLGATSGLGQQMQAQALAQMQAAARQAAQANAQALQRIAGAWRAFGSELGSVVSQITNRMATTASGLLPGVGGILGGALRGGQMGAGLGASGGMAIGSMIPIPGAGLIGGALGGLGGLVGGGFLGGMASAAVEGMTLAIHAMEAAFRKALSAIEDTISAMIRLGMEYEKTKTAFEVFTGSAQKGNKLFSELQDVALKTPFTFRQISDVGQRLLGMGLPAEELIATLGRLGDIASGDAERLRRLSLAFGQVFAAGRFYGTELRQFTEAGVGIEDFAKAVGMTTAQFRLAMNEGRITFNDLVKGINALTNEGGRFFGMSSQQLNTVNGQWTNMVEKVQLLLGSFGSQAFARLGIVDSFKELNSLIDRISPVVFEQLLRVLDLVKAAMLGVGDALKAVWPQVFESFMRFTKSIDTTPAGLERIRMAVLEMTKSFLAFAEVVTGIFLGLASFVLDTFIIPLLETFGKREQSSVTPFISNPFNNGGNITAERPVRQKTANEELLESLRSLSKSISQFAKDFRENGIKFFQDARGAITLQMGKSIPQRSWDDLFRSGVGGKLLEGSGIASKIARTVSNFDVVDRNDLRWAATTLIGLGPNIKTEGGAVQAAIFGMEAAKSLMSGLMSATGWKQISNDLKITVDPDVQKLIQELRQNFKEGFTPLEKFTNKRNMILEAFPHSLLKPEETLPLSEQGLKDRLAGRQGLFQNFQELQRQFSQALDPVANMPKTAFRDSQEATSAANRINSQRLDHDQQMRDVLMIANKQREAQAKALEKFITNQEKTNQILEDIRGVRPPVGPPKPENIP